MLTNDALVMKFKTLRVDLNYNLSVYINKGNIVSVNVVSHLFKTAIIKIINL